MRGAYLKTVGNTIALAREIGVPVINMHLAKGICITLPGKKTFLFSEYNDEYMTSLRAFRELCEKLIGDSGVKLAVENTGGFMEHERAAVEMLLQSPCFGLTLDVGHSHAAGDADIEFFMRHIGKLIHMHAHDARGTSNHLAFGDGEIDIKQRLGLAKSTNSRVVLETKTVQALTSTVRSLPLYI